MISFIKKRKNYKFIIGALLGIMVPIIGVYAISYIGSGSDLTYDNSSSGLASTNVQDALDELYKYKECPKGYQCFKLGAYVSMMPTKYSYTTDTSKTGDSSTQTIYPQELNLWRIISVNSDGTVDVISEYTSSKSVEFEGETGYQNLIGYLNLLASQYENSTYTKSSRYFGYNGQTEYVTLPTKNGTAPWRCSTGESCNPTESEGGGDTLYQKDYDLVKNTLGTLKATGPNGTGSGWYWIATRYYNYNYNQSTTNFYFYGYSIDYSGSLNKDKPLYYYTNSSYSKLYGNFTLRPIVTLKSGLKYSGSGTKDDPYKLST